MRHFDWLEMVMVLGIANEIALFKRSYATIFFMALAPGADPTNKIWAEIYATLFRALLLFEILE